MPGRSSGSPPGKPDLAHLRFFVGLPVEKASPSYRSMGFRDMFVARSFIETSVVGARRHVMRLKADNRVR